MKNHKLRKLAAFALVAALLAACNARPELLASPSAPTKTNHPPTLQRTATETPTPAATTESAAGLCANPLAPVNMGATWAYANAGGSGTPASFTTTITNVRLDGFTVATRFDDGSSVDQEWACKSEGLMALSLGAGQSGLGLSLSGVQAHLTTSNATGLTLPTDVQPGMKWPYGLDLSGTLSQGTLSAAITGTVQTEFQAIGTGSVTVPAGTFDAMKVEGVSTLRVKADYYGLSLPMTSVINTTFWFAPGVGLIKSAESGELVGTAINEVTVLQSYNIP